MVCAALAHVSGLWHLEPKPDCSAFSTWGQCRIWVSSTEPEAHHSYKNVFACKMHIKLQAEKSVNYDHCWFHCYSHPHTVTKWHWNQDNLYSFTNLLVNTFQGRRLLFLKMLKLQWMMTLLKSNMNWHTVLPMLATLAILMVWRLLVHPASYYNFILPASPQCQGWDKSEKTEHCTNSLTFTTVAGQVQIESSCQWN